MLYYIYILVPGKSGRKMGPRKETVAIPRNYGRVLLATAQFWHVLATHLEETMFTNNFYIYSFVEASAHGTPVFDEIFASRRVNPTTQYMSNYQEVLVVFDLQHKFQDVSSAQALPQRPAQQSKVIKVPEAPIKGVSHPKHWAQVCEYHAFRRKNPTCGSACHDVPWTSMDNTSYQPNKDI